MLSSCGESVGRDTAVTPTEAPEESIEAEISADTSTTAEIAASTAVTTTAAPAKKTGTPPDSAIINISQPIEVYAGVTLKDIVSETNTVLLEPDLIIDTGELGEKTVKVKFDFEDGTYEKDVTYTVVDTTEPTILNSGWEPYAIINQPFDLDAIVGYADNYDRCPTLTYSGEVDTGNFGVYPISVTVSDSSGNSKSWDMDVMVVSEKPAPVDDNERVSYQDFKNYYAYENVRYGIDVSAWQTDVDYNAVKSEGCEFVLMRMGYYYSTVKMDDYYPQNMENATAAGLDVGVYFYSADNTQEGAREHARWIVEQLGGRQLDLPVAFDWEEWGHFQEYGINLHDLNDIYLAFSDEMKKNGYSTMLYSSKNFLNTVWDARTKKQVWLAHYVDETDYEGNFSIWQASAYGRISGIEGDVDMNIQFMDAPLE